MDFTDIDVSLPSNTTLDACLLIFFEGCTRLKSFTLLRCRKLTDEALSYLIAFCPLIENIHIGSSANISDVTLNNLLQCSNLKSLSLKQCPRLTANGISSLFDNAYFKLENLDLSSSHSVCQQVARSIIKMDCLSCLNLSECPNFSGADALLLIKKDGIPFEILNLENNAQISHQTIQQIQRTFGVDVASASIIQ